MGPRRSGGSAGSFVWFGSGRLWQTNMYAGVDGGGGGLETSSVGELCIEANARLKTGNQIVVQYTFIHGYKCEALHPVPSTSSSARISTSRWVIGQYHTAVSLLSIY